MNITQDVLINRIAAKENLNTETVRQVIKSTETVIFDCLSSTDPAEDVTVKLFHGFHIKRKYVNQKNYSKGMFQNIDCPEHVNLKANISKYYHERVNQRLFHKSC